LCDDYSRFDAHNVLSSVFSGVGIFLLLCIHYSGPPEFFR